MNEFEKLKLKVKFELYKRKSLEVARRYAEWIMNNKEVVIPLATLGVAGMRTVGKIQRDAREDKLHERRFYDPRKGRYVESRRKLNTKEELELERRYNQGESYRSILYDMGLLK